MQFNASGRPAYIPSDWIIPRPSTGADNPDKPADERDDENRPARAPGDRAEAPEKSGYNDFARDPAKPAKAPQ